MLKEVKKRLTQYVNKVFAKEFWLSLGLLGLLILVIFLQILGIFHLLQWMF